MRHLLANIIKCPDGTLLRSIHRHDFQTHRDETNGELYGVDGGLAYSRWVFPEGKPPEDMCVYSDDSHEKIRNNFFWGTYGKYGNEPLKYILLKDMEEDHIKKILDTKACVDYIATVFRNELKYRWKTETN